MEVVRVTCVVLNQGGNQRIFFYCMENQTKKVAAASDGSACDLNSVGVGGNGNGLTDGVGVGANSSGAVEEEGIIELHDLRLSPIASLRNRHRPLGGATARHLAGPPSLRFSRRHLNAAESQAAARWRCIAGAHVRLTCARVVDEISLQPRKSGCLIH